MAKTEKNGSDRRGCETRVWCGWTDGANCATMTEVLLTRVDVDFRQAESEVWAALANATEPSAGV